MRNKIVFIGSIVLLVLLLGAWAYVRFLAPKTAQVESSSSSAAEEVVEAPSYSLTERQQKEIALYKEEEIALLDLLNASKWINGKGNAYLVFDNSTWTETKDGVQSKPHTFAFMSTYNFTLSDGTRKVTVASIDTDSGNSMLVVTEIYNGKAIEEISISSDVFPEGTYIRGEQVEKVKVDELNKEAKKFFGDNDEKLYTLIDTLVQNYYPSVKEAHWTGETVIDWNSMIAQTKYILNNKDHTNFIVYYDMKKEVWEVVTDNLNLLSTNLEEDEQTASKAEEDKTESSTIEEAPEESSSSESEGE